MSEYNFIIGEYLAKPNPRIKILTGQRFGRLLIIGYAGSAPPPRGGALWHVLCDCGNAKTLRVTDLTSGKTRSCGCFQKEARHTNHLTHGHGRKNEFAEYRVYCHAKGRCQNPTDAAYPRYGGKGIEFRFESFEQFLEVLGYKPSPELTLERINNKGHYEPGNCKWDTRKNQARNREYLRPITAFGKSQLACEWAEQTGVKAALLTTRRKSGWCGECSLTIPANGGTCSHRE